MERRDFLKSMTAISGVFLCDLDEGMASSRLNRSRVRKERGLPLETPGLDEFSGDWVKASVLEQIPALSNFHGSVEATRNILGFQNFTLWPFAQGFQSAVLSLDGAEVDAQDFRWYPYQVLRRARTDRFEIVTTVRMPFESSGVFFTVVIGNVGKKPLTSSINISLDTVIRNYTKKWEWDTPRPGEKDKTDFKASVLPEKGSRILLVEDRGSESNVIFAFTKELREGLDPIKGATWDLHLKENESFRLGLVMAASTDFGSAKEQLSDWLAQFTAKWDEAKVCWEKRFQAAFTPENDHFSGNLPIFVSSDSKMRRLYYTSVVSLLCLERTNLNPKFPRVFVTASPRWATTLVYFWDTSFFATVWSLLDPLAMREQLKLFLESGIHSCYAIDFKTLQPVGPWYSANDYSVFRLVTTYVYVTGDWKFFEETLPGNRKVIDVLEELSLYWQKLTKQYGLLANYGDASNLLETVPTYEGYVPAMNAANVWMMRSMAELKVKRGEPDRAAQLNRLADRLAAEILGLYVPGKGFWSCQLPDGKRVEVRHCIDFFTLIDCMERDLGPRRVSEMVDFVNRELWTPHWLRALSLQDGATKFATRADHGWPGSYDAWPPLTAEAMFRVGHREEALERLRSVEPAIHEGPFGQAHYVATERYPVRKALSSGQDYFASASGSFAEVILRTFFGFAPDAESEWKLVPPQIPGFEGSLVNLRFRGEVVTTMARL